MKAAMLQNTVPPPVTGAGRPAGAPRSAQEGAFGEMLKASIDSVHQLQQAADTSIENLATGREADIHRTMIAMEKASVSFELVMQVRNKLVAAYEEIMRMQV